MNFDPAGDDIPFGLGRRSSASPIGPFPLPTLSEEAADAFAEQIIENASKRAIDPSPTFPHGEAAYYVLAWGINDPACMRAVEILITEAIARRSPRIPEMNKPLPDPAEYPGEFVGVVLSRWPDPAVVAGSFTRDLTDPKMRTVAEFLVHEALISRAALEVAK